MVFIPHLDGTADVKLKAAFSREILAFFHLPQPPPLGQKRRFCLLPMTFGFPL